MRDVSKIHETATSIGREVRDYVRDHFKPGGITSLDDLASYVQLRVEIALYKELNDAPA